MNDKDIIFTLHRELQKLLGEVEKLNVALSRATYPEFMPVQQAADYLGLSASHLNKLRSTGGGPLFCDFGVKAVRYRRTDLDTWAEQHKRAHTTEKQTKRR